MKCYKLYFYISVITILTSVLLFSSCGNKLAKEDWPEINKEFRLLHHIDGTKSALGMVPINGMLTIKDGIMLIAFEDGDIAEYIITSCREMKSNRYSCRFRKDGEDNGKVKFTIQECGKIRTVEIDYTFEVFLLH